LVKEHLAFYADPFEALIDATIFFGDADELAQISDRLARRDGPIIGLQGWPSGSRNLVLERLLVERSQSVNTAAAGGNASLMTIG
jgi:RHH-type proline utilization regulon transcriptional repressor/proline dehydrogenase/delta 1-pyrroline-5-carboxylate dehydrogenase